MSSLALGFIVAVLVLMAGGFVLIYNRLVRLRNRVDNAWSQVDVQLRRRYDLIPALVETVRAYAAHEAQTFRAVAQSRGAAQEAATVEEQAKAESALTGALGGLLAVAEDYPELRSSENFRDLHESLVEAEDKIAVARHIYNDSTLNYNNSIETIPANLVAKTARFLPRPYFRAAERAVEPPGVKL